MAAITLATALGNASSTAVTVPGPPHISTVQGEYLFVTWGTFGGGSYALEYTTDAGTTWVAISTSHTSAKAERVFVPEGASVRVTGSGGTANTVNALIDR